MFGNAPLHPPTVRHVSTPLCKSSTEEFPAFAFATTETSRRAQSTRARQRRRQAHMNNLQRHPPWRTDEPLNKPHYTAVTPKSMPTLRQTWPRLETSAARCVRDVDDQGVLQFTLLHAVCCALHRRTSRVIHRLELFCISRIQVVS